MTTDTTVLTVTSSGQPVVTAGMLPKLWAQTHALRTVADLLDRVGLPSLYVSFCDDHVAMLVPGDLGDEPARTAAVARLAAALGATVHRPARTTTRSFLSAEADLAGHPVRVSTPINHHGEQEMTP